MRCNASTAVRSPVSKSGPNLTMPRRRSLWISSGACNMLSSSTRGIGEARLGAPLCFMRFKIAAPFSNAETTPAMHAWVIMLIYRLPN